MELRVLKYFLAIAREENITKAADILHITQPTLSRQIMQLEDELGQKLFNRGAKFSLTEKGVLLRRRAEEIIELTKKTEKEITNSATDFEGTIYIGAGETYSMHIWAKLIKQFSDMHSKVNFDLYSGNADDIKDKMDNGLIDISLLIEPVDIEKYDFIRLPAQETFGILMRKGSHLANKDSITAKELENQPLILSQRNIVQKQMIKWFGKQYKTLNIKATYNLIYNASIMVEEGLGYAFVLKNLVSCNENLCFKPLSPDFNVGVVIAWKKYQIFSEHTRSFLNYIKSNLKN